MCKKKSKDYPLGLSTSLTQAPERMCNFVMSICTFSIASINAFSKLCTSVTRWGQDDRHDVMIRIDGQDIPMLYDTGAAATFLTLKTFQKYFSHAQRSNHKTNIVGAGNNNLGLYGSYTLPAA